MNVELQHPLHVFFCYAREDKKLRDDLDRHLSSLKRQKVIETWHEYEIVAGVNRQHAIDTYFRKADVVLLLISSDFISSDYCYSHEMQQAMHRHEADSATVLPILLRPVDITGAPFSHLQMLPRDNTPVTLWKNQDEAFFYITQDIRQAIDTRASKLIQSQPIITNKKVGSSSTANDLKQFSDPQTQEKGYVVDGIEDFAAAIDTVPAVTRDLFVYICDWARNLEKVAPVKLQTYHGKSHRLTLLPRLRDDMAGLISIYNVNGTLSLQFWRSVFVHRAPLHLRLIEQHYGEVGQGNYLHKIDQNLFDILTNAYLEAANLPVITPSEQLTEEYKQPLPQKNSDRNMIDLIVEAAFKISADKQSVSLANLYDEYMNSNPGISKGSTHASFDATVNYHCINMRSRFSDVRKRYQKNAYWITKPLFKRVSRGRYMLLSQEEVTAFQKCVQNNVPLIYEDEYDVSLMLKENHAQ
ncbi:toll/interleukin-1 receptor domain-containing protein [Dictyobacter aurantiacus]|uniref:TIR domain-containing protein n=1 Tax=Dictyobacter aurantiacus TaxID=1936993 RepID=A0A401ZR07_9CHLR|nr:toll/interleukin-1 receptor domain-containing protein [Dictyobacter aurantiacus]GCE09305.1 hypothetical protein KDAU_66340 [Dictyobacter aurantiacus]